MTRAAALLAAATAARRSATTAARLSAATARLSAAAAALLAAAAAALLAAATAALVFGGALGGCGEDEEAARRRARLERQRARQAAVPLNVAAPAPDRALLTRLTRWLSSHKPPFRVTATTAPADELLEGLDSGALDLALVAGLPTPAEREALGALTGRLRSELVGVDPVALVANATNRTGRLALVDVRSVFRDGIRRWDAVAGDALPLVAYILDPPGGVTRLLRRDVLGGAPIHPEVRRVPDVATQLESVRRTPGGLALVPLSRLHGVDLRESRLKLLALAALRTTPGSRPTDAAAAALDRYPLLLPVMLFVRRGEDRRARRLARRLSPANAARLASPLALPAPPPPRRDALRRPWTPPTSKPTP